MPLDYQALDDLIAKQEGYGKPGTIATDQNNPGNLIDNSWTASQPGYIGGGRGGIAVFSDPASGFAAEDANVGAYASRGATISDLTAGWAPAEVAGNDPAAYAQNLSAGLGVPVTTPVSQLAGASPSTAGAQSSNPFSTLDQWAMKLDQWFGTTYPGEPAGAEISGAAGSAFSIGRVAAFVLGLIFIAGGIFLLKPEASVKVVTRAAGAAVLV